jgi:hypothetical protein
MKKKLLQLKTVLLGSKGIFLISSFKQHRFVSCVNEKLSKRGNSLYRGKGMLLHVQLSTNCGLGCFKNKTKYFLFTNSHFLSGLTTAQAVDPLPLYRDFPVQKNENKFCCVFIFTRKEGAHAID